MRAFLGLGSNLGDRLANLVRAVGALNSHGIEVGRVSSVYETDPVGPPQPEFLNAVCEISTDLAPRDLLAVLKSIEKEIGRTHSERWGPREIDLDILLYGQTSIDEPGLVVPHPELTKRDFVLVPLLEIAADLELPSGEPVSAFSTTDHPGVRRIGTL